MQQASSLASLSAASEFVPVPSYRAWANRVGEVWEYTPKTGAWRECPNSPLHVDGRRQVSMTSDDGTRVQRVRAQVIYETFHGPLIVGYDVDHRDENPTNDAADNLQLLSRSAHGSRHKARKPLRRGSAVRAVSRTGEVRVFVSHAKCAEEFGCANNRVQAAIIRGTYAKRSHSPFKDWIVTAA